MNNQQDINATEPLKVKETIYLACPYSGDAQDKHIGLFLLLRKLMS